MTQERRYQREVGDLRARLRDVIQCPVADGDANVIEEHMRPGQQVAGYRIESVLGQGGMGIVYEATQLSLNRTVALKILSPQFSADPVFRERFRREGQIQAAIDHPHIVTVHEAGETDEGLFIAMRLVRGSTLKDLILGGALDGQRVMRLLEPIAEALDTAHEAGLTHRDIKPQNILVGARDHAFLADFGLTKSTSEKGLTKTGHFLGTIDYVSPEQIRGEQATGASDIYALAAVLYECLCGTTPFPRPNDAAVLFAHAHTPPPRVTEGRPGLPPALDEVIARGMAKDARERPPSAVAMVSEAARALQTPQRAVAAPTTVRGAVVEPATPPAETASTTSHETPGPSRARRPRRRIVAGLAILAAGLAATIALVTSGGDGGGGKAVVGPVKLGGLLGRATVADGAVWVPLGFDEGVARVDATTLDMEVIKGTGKHRIGEFPVAAAAGAGRIWVADEEADKVSAIDIATRRVVDTIFVGDDPTDIAFADGVVWTADCECTGRADKRSSVSRIDARSGRVKQISVNGHPLGLGVGDDFVWVTDERGAVRRIDARAGEVVGGPIAVGDFPTDVVVDDTGIWVSLAGEDSVVRIDRRTLRPDPEKIAVGSRPWSLALGGGLLWVSHAGDGSLRRIDPRQRRVVGKTLFFGGRPAAGSDDPTGDGLAYGEGRVWHAGHRTGNLRGVRP